jgi:dTDP-4-amino-4,6-dideoxygalactose transaminase
MSIRIPFNKPFIIGKEMTYVAEAVVANQHASGDGPFTKRVQALLEERFGAHRVLLTTSCTAALELAGLLCGLGPGDEVIMPSFTFVSTANAAVLRGARPVFVDIRPDTLNLDERLVEAAITSRTRAIFPVHYAGVGCEMDALRDIALRHGLLVVEDAAQGVHARHRGCPLGTIGDIGCYSFHETKNFSCGEGGAIVLNRPELAERAEVLWEKGTNRRRFLRGQTDKYTWVDVGSSFLPSDMLAAYLLGQIEHMEAISARRGELWCRYRDRLAPLEAAGVARLPFLPASCTPNYHMFYLLTDGLAQRTDLIAHLRARGILAVFHYVPLHTSPFGRSLTNETVSLPETERVSDRLVRLPMYYALSPAEVDEVADAVLEFYRIAR